MASTSNNFNDRIITQIAIIKDSSFDQNLRNERKQSTIDSIARQKKSYTNRCQEQISGAREVQQRINLGISIVQGSDKNIYVKDLVRDSPAERHGKYNIKFNLRPTFAYFLINRIYLNNSTGITIGDQV